MGFGLELGFGSAVAAPPPPGRWLAPARRVRGGPAHRATSHRCLGRVRVRVRARARVRVSVRVSVRVRVWVWVWVRFRVRFRVRLGD